VLTATQACRLLESSDRLALARLSDALGAAPPTPLPRAVRDSLQLPPSIAAAQVAERGTRLRVLLGEVRATDPMREILRRLAQRLLTHAPHRLWVTVLWRRDPDETAIAVLMPGSPAPQISALVVRRGRVVDSDGQTFAAVAAVPTGVDDDLVHLRWADLLGRTALTARFYKALDGAVRRLADTLPSAVPAATRRPLAITAASRQLFLAFLETKGWLDGDRAFLARTFDACMASGGGYHRRVLHPLWFGTLNTRVSRRASAALAFGRVPFLNGGLFGRTPEERRHAAAWFDDEALGHLAGDVLGRFRFTAREEARTFREAAVDPEMLGLAFESLMAADDRKATGAFYTPPTLVDAVTRDALAEALTTRAVPPDAVALALAGEPPIGRARGALLARAQQLTVCDPACGSGAFLVRLLDTLAAVRQVCGDPLDDAALRRDILARQLHGVDRNPVAVWLCELRLWLAVVVAHDEPDPRRVPPLPNLDRHVRVGDALAGGDFGLGADAAVSRRVATARERYARATGPRKKTLARHLDAVERAAAMARLDRERDALRHARRERLLAARGRDLFGARVAESREARAARQGLREQLARLGRERARLAAGGALPFSFAAHFASVAAARGFDLVIGNPPWVRPHHVETAERERWRQQFRVQREGAWRSGAADAGAGTGFAGQVDLAALFTERGLSLVRPSGHLAFLVPAKLWRSLAGGGWRALLAEVAEVRRLEDWSDGPSTFDAAVYPGVVIAQRRTEVRSALAPDATPTPPAAVAAHAPTRVVVVRRGTAIVWDTTPAHLAFDATRGAPWLLLPPPVRRAFDALRDAGVPMARSSLGRPTLGVKCGVNDAFIVERIARPAPEAPMVAVRAGDRESALERPYVRPLVRGDTCAAWRVTATAEALVFPHDADGPLATLPPGLSHWLGPWRRRLVSRTDIRASRHRPWWMLFRTDAARGDRPRVVWGDFGRVPRAAVLPAGARHVPLNSCYVLALPTDDEALAFAALLNSTLAAAWLGAIAEPARGGWKRFLGWTVAQLPIPRDWPSAVRRLAPLGAAGWRGAAPSVDVLFETVAASYDLPPARLRPLLEWAAA
jgi:hypothetical protein